MNLLAISLLMCNILSGNGYYYNGGYYGDIGTTDTTLPTDSTAVTTDCGGVLITESGVIQSPNFPNRYPKNENCEWTVVAPGDKVITLTFNDFDIEGEGCQYDFVVIYDGDEKIAKKCGSNIPDPVTTNTNTLRITFESDNVEQLFGFKASYSMIGTTDTTPPSDSTTTDCGGVLTTESGVIQSPNFPNRYPKNANCEWTVVAPGDKVITLTFNDFDLEAYNCKFDFVVIYDGDEKIAKKCGSNIPDPVTTNTNTLRITFESDDVEQLFGFKASYSMIGTTGTTLPSDSTVTTVTTGTTDKTTVTAVTTGKTDTTLPSDSTAVTTGTTDTTLPSDSTVTAVTTGTSDTTLHSDSTVTAVTTGTTDTTLPSDSTVTAVTTGTTDTTLPSDSTVTTVTTGTTDTTLPSDSTVTTVTTGTSDTTLPSDSTAVTTGTTDTTLPSDSTVTTVTTGTSDTTLHSDSTVTAVTTGTTDTTLPSDSTVTAVTTGTSYATPPTNSTAVTTDCGGVLTTESGVIQSPNFPNRYPKNANCEWTVVAPGDKVITLTFNDFDLEGEGCRYDVVVIYDGDEIIDVRCGSDIPDPVTTNTNTLRITFESDEQVQLFGFKASYSMIGGDSDDDGGDDNDGGDNDNDGGDNDGSGSNQDDDDDDPVSDVVTLVLIIFGTLFGVVILVVGGIYFLLKVQANKVIELKNNKKRRGKKQKPTNPRVKDLPPFPIFKKLPNVTKGYHPPPSITSGYKSQPEPSIEVEDMDHPSEERY